jgi:sugar phosphate permease
VEARRGRPLVFALTWVSYASYYLCRKNFAVAKATLERVLHLSPWWQAAIDTAYLVAYAVGQFGSGILGDRIGARRLVGFGMLASAAACVLFGASSAALVFLFLWAVNGLAQSTGWPGNTKAMAAWFEPAERGTVMGFWSTCYQAGGLAANPVAAFLLAALGWRAALLGPAGWVACVGIAVLLFLPARPGEPRDDRASVPLDPALVRAERARIYRSPQAWSYAMSYFCVKAIRYTILLWLPYYLEHELAYGAMAGFHSVSFEVGGLGGAVAFGLISDRVRLPRSAVSAIGLACLAASLLLYTRIAAAGGVANFAGMALVGFMLFGPDSLLAGAAAQDLGGKHAAATAVGFVNGVGSVGAIVQGFLTVAVSDAFGWNAVFLVLLAFAAVAALCLVPSIRRRE